MCLVVGPGMKLGKLPRTGFAGGALLRPFAPLELKGIRARFNLYRGRSVVWHDLNV